jgi:hypothetical protein
MPRGRADGVQLWGARIVATVLATALMAVIGAAAAAAAEYGTGPWVRGYTDIFGGVLPTVPGIYVRADAYHYDGNADKTIFDGRVALSIDETYTASIFALSYVTPLKILGGTYAVAVVPSMVAMNVDVGVRLAPFTGPRGNTFGPLDF